MYDVLVTGSVVYTGSEVIRDGYVYIKAGRIRDVGKQPVPEDYTFATLVLGGPHRIVVPGLAVVADAAAYPIRYSRPSVRERIRYYKNTPRRLRVYSALLGVYELHMRGATTVFIEEVEPDVVVDVASMAGGRYGVAFPACVEERKAPLPTVRISGEDCVGEASLGAGEVPYLAGLGVYDLARVGDRIWEANFRLREISGTSTGRIEVGEVAEVAVFDSRMPPIALLDLYPQRAPLAPLMGARVESLIVGDEVLVDGGQHLNIGFKHVSEARELAEKYIVGRGQ
ncbi:MAG: hypothetical protein GSR80_000143 [Desulfurococcales archaeon]|nr:hypothetical protein [Desulfurococcales archaeon]